MQQCHCNVIGRRVETAMWSYTTTSLTCGVNNRVLQLPTVQTEPLHGANIITDQYTRILEKNGWKNSYTDKNLMRDKNIVIWSDY